tara:strand:+ start:174 stop:287 length:114 start_codon:yes stop_codon:yes gene_type:complete
MGIEAYKTGQLQEALPFFKTASGAYPNIGQSWTSHIL